MKAREIDSEHFVTTAWSGGETTEMFIYPEGSNYAKRNFNIRISSATVNDDISIFTRLEGVDRYLAPLEGDISLEIDGKKPKKILPMEVVHFSGESETISRGKCIDFNLMLKGNVNGELRSVKLPKEGTAFKIKKSYIYIFYSFNSVVFVDKHIASKNKIVVIEGDRQGIIELKPILGGGDCLIAEVAI